MTTRIEYNALTKSEVLALPLTPGSVLTIMRLIPLGPIQQGCVLSDGETIRQDIRTAFRKAAEYDRLMALESRHTEWGVWIRGYESTVDIFLSEGEAIESVLGNRYWLSTEPRVMAKRVTSSSEWEIIDSINDQAGRKA